MHRPVVLLARVLAYINILDVVPGTVFVPDLFEAMIEKCRFQLYAQKREDIDIEKGIEFTDGTIGGITIERFVIFKNLLILETRVSTDASKDALESLLMWGTENFSFRYQPGDIKRFAYINDFVFESDADLLLIDPVMKWLSEETSSALTEIWQEPVEYLPISIKTGHDPVLRHLGIASFSIERRGAQRFSDNQYFSEAPLPTALHLSLLKQFEEKVLHGTNVKTYGRGKTER